MQYNPTLLQRSKSGVTIQGPIPITGLVPSGQMGKELSTLLSSPLTLTAGIAMS